MVPNINRCSWAYWNGMLFVSLRILCNPSIDFACARRWSPPRQSGKSLHKRFKVISSDTGGTNPVILSRHAIPWKLPVENCPLPIFFARRNISQLICTWDHWLLVYGMHDASSAWCFLLVWRPCFNVGITTPLSLNCMHRFVVMAARTNGTNWISSCRTMWPTRWPTECMIGIGASENSVLNNHFVRFRCMIAWSYFDATSGICFVGGTFGFSVLWWYIYLEGWVADLEIGLHKLPITKALALDGFPASKKWT